MISERRRNVPASRALATLAAAASLLVPATAGAEVVEASPAGFLLVNEETVPVSPSTAWTALVEEVDLWWPKDHTWWGEASTLSIEPRAGGCFCEIAEGRQAQHLTVSHVDPPKLLRMLGGLGPLQGMGLHGALEWRLEPLAEGTRITLRYQVGGYTPDDLSEFAPVVDRVQALQLAGLAEHLRTPEEQPVRCPVEGPLAGVWEAEGGDPQIRFHGTGADLTFAMVQDGRLEQVAPVVACGEGFVEICYFARRHRMDLELRDGRLEVDHRTTDTRRTYRPVDGVPGLFEPEPLELADPEPVPSGRVAEIRGELAVRLERDQEVRQQPIDAGEMMRVDADNTAYLKDLLAEVGWIDAGRFGDEAADAAFLIVQHSGDLPLMLAALPRLREQGRLGEYALLYDRTQLRLGGEQRYGTQIGWTEGGTKGLLPLETLEGIDARRAEMGLGPLAEYLALFDIEEPRVLRCQPE